MNIDEINLLLFALALKGGFQHTRIQLQFFELLRAGQELDSFIRSHAKRLGPRDWNIAEREMVEAKKRNVSVLTPLSAEYPKLLLEISDPPLVLFWLGPMLNIAATAVVGARSASVQGLEMAFQVSQLLARNNECVVSGLALGLDAAAHRGALSTQSNFPTIAVLGSGVLNFQPRSNHQLAQQILNSGGAIVSEFGVTLCAQRHHFPRRNRIIAGLCQRTIVVEAAKRSGSLITAQFSLEQGREVYAVAGPPLSQEYAGCNQLLKQGANLLLEPSDLIADDATDSKSDFANQRFIVAKNLLEGLCLAKTKFDFALKILEQLELLKVASASDLEQTIGASDTTFSVILSLLELEGVIFQQNGQFSLGQSVDSM